MSTNNEPLYVELVCKVSRVIDDWEKLIEHLEHNGDMERAQFYKSVKRQLEKVLD